jgi:hypothetical protein
MGIVYVCVRVAVKLDCSHERAYVLCHKLQTLACCMAYVYIVTDVTEIHTFYCVNIVTIVIPENSFYAYLKILNVL